MKSEDDKQSRLHALFHSPEAEALKVQICDIGRRLWQRGYVEGNGGNISARLAPDIFLCTPTGVSKGFLAPGMLCLAEGNGNLLFGEQGRSSEFTTHLSIYHNTPSAQAVVHGHPMHATAFAILGLEIPERLLPEMEVRVGRVGRAPYRRPGSPELAAVVGPLAPLHQSIIMEHHGLICWGSGVEDAYFKMEITETYCRTVAIARQLGGRGTCLSHADMATLLKMKKGRGLPDSREGRDPREVWTTDPWEISSSGADGR